VFTRIIFANTLNGRGEKKIHAVRINLNGSIEYKSLRLFHDDVVVFQAEGIHPFKAKAYPQ